MKLTMMALAAFAAVSAQGRSENERQVTVYLGNSIVVPLVVMAQAKSLASKMFAGIGVALNLREVRPAALETGAIIIELDDRTPAGFLPYAWAYALPFEGFHIRIFWNRLQGERCSQQLLAHVMVHEITHILQGVDGHSAEGIMNARWTKQERLALERSPLRFTAVDVDRIYHGMDARGARWAGQTLAAIPPTVASISAVQ